MTAARLVSANPGEKVKISVIGLTFDSGNEQGYALITQAKCLEDKLADLGVDADVSAEGGSPELQNKLNSAFDKAFDKATGK